jgi:hypothetical protein
MRSLKKVEQGARIASRRFSKGIICRIISGELLVGFLQASGLVPKGLEFTDNVRYAVSLKRQRVFVVPLYNYPELEVLAGEAGVGSIPSSGPPAVPLNPEEERVASVFKFEREVRKKDILYDFLQQNMIMVAINLGSLPKDGLLRMVESCDVIIDSIDSGQASRGDFVFKTAKIIGDYETWDSQ